MLLKQIENNQWSNIDINLNTISKPFYQNKEHYEVIFIQNLLEYTVGGNIIKAHESFPGDNFWGSLAFSCLSLESAEKRFNQLLKSQPA